MPFETAHPAVGPEDQVIAQHLTHVLLFDAKRIQDFALMISEMVVHTTVLGGVKTEHRRIADASIATRHPSAAFFQPIMNHAEMTRLVCKKIIQRTGQHNVQIQKQRIAIQISKPRLK